MNQVCEVKQMMEKYCEKSKCVYLAFMDQQKAYYIIEWIEGQCGRCCKCMLGMLFMERQ